VNGHSINTIPTFELKITYPFVGILKIFGFVRARFVPLAGDFLGFTVRKRRSVVRAVLRVKYQRRYAKCTNSSV